MGSVTGRGRAVIVGAGIAGLATGNALRRLGYEVRLLEREPRLRAEGAGLTLWPNAIARAERAGTRGRGESMRTGPGGRADDGA